MENALEKKTKMALIEVNHKSSTRGFLNNGKLYGKKEQDYDMEIVVSSNGSYILQCECRTTSYGILVKI